MPFNNDSSYANKEVSSSNKEGYFDCCIHPQGRILEWVRVDHLSPPQVLSSYNQISDNNISSIVECYQVKVKPFITKSSP